jgi:hypothetical protein
MRTSNRFWLVAWVSLGLICGAKAQSITFNFDDAPQYAPLPIDLTEGGITGHFSSSSSFYNYSIQRADVLGFIPRGFSGLCIYPSTVFASDLLMSFNAQLKDISVLYAPEEYATDSSCIMRLTAYLGTTLVGTITYQIPIPGTWPSGTLVFSSASPFDNVVIHYEAPPPTGGDYGPIFMADNLVITPFGSSSTPTVVSQKPHGRSGVFSIDMPLTGASGVEDRSGGANGSFTIVFSYPTSPAGATATVTAHNPVTGTGSVSRVTYNGNDMIVYLTRVSDQQILTLSTSGGTVAPVSVPIGFLVGDVDGDRVVTQNDSLIVKGQNGQTVTSANFRSDVVVNGTINSQDVKASSAPVFRKSNCRIRSGQAAAVDGLSTRCGFA